MANCCKTKEDDVVKAAPPHPGASSKAKELEEPLLPPPDVETGDAAEDEEDEERGPAKRGGAKTRRSKSKPRKKKSVSSNASDSSKSSGRSSKGDYGAINDGRRPDSGPGGAVSAQILTGQHSIKRGLMILLNICIAGVIAYFTFTQDWKCNHWFLWTVQFYGLVFLVQAALLLTSVCSGDSGFGKFLIYSSVLIAFGMVTASLLFFFLFYPDGFNLLPQNKSCGPVIYMIGRLCFECTPIYQGAALFYYLALVLLS